MVRDVVVGCITNYTIDKVKYWVNSLNRSGFDGYKMVICYNVDKLTLEYLQNNDITVICFNIDKEGNATYPIKDFNICVDRFIHIPLMLSGAIDEKDVRYVIATDVRDVIFQGNPSTWLENNIKNESIVASSESIKYKDETWGNNNLRKSLGDYMSYRLSDNIIYNAGVIAGKYKSLMSLMTNVYYICRGLPSHIEGGGGPDQAAYNLLLNLEQYNQTTHFVKSEQGWSAQLGTTVDPNKYSQYKDKLDEPSPIMHDNIVCTSKKIPFTIVHQYDRVPKWKTIIEKKYE